MYLKGLVNVLTVKFAHVFPYGINIKCDDTYINGVSYF